MPYTYIIDEESIQKYSTKGQKLTHLLYEEITKVYLSSSRIKSNRSRWFIEPMLIIYSMVLYDQKDRERLHIAVNYYGHSEKDKEAEEYKRLVETLHQKLQHKPYMIKYVYGGGFASFFVLWMKVFAFFLVILLVNPSSWAITSAFFVLYTIITYFIYRIKSYEVYQIPASELP